MRMRSVLQQHLNNKVITKDPAREKQWLDARIIEAMVIALIDDAHYNGELCVIHLLNVELID